MTNESTRPDILIIQGRMTKGYGIIPKMPMQDKRLTIEAKAIYSYFCSYAGAGSTAFPSRAKILNDLQIGEKRYYTHFNLLKKYGYITVEQNANNKGKFKNNVYTLVEMIEPYSQNGGTEPCSRFACTGDAYTGDGGTKNNSIKNNNILENQKSKSKSKSDPVTLKEETDKTKTLTVDVEIKKEPSIIPPADQSKELFESSKNETYDNYTIYEQLIKDNIDYDHFLTYRSTAIEEVDELINCMLDVICTEGNTVKINGENKSRAMVKSQYLKINFSDIEHILDNFKEQRHKITHVHAYLKTMLYNCKQENGHFYTNAVRVDGLIS